MPYLLDIQNDILKNINSRLVIPLGLKKPYNDTLNPKIKIDDEEFTILTTQMASISINILGEKVTSLKEKRADIINAVDFIITGF